MLDLLNVMLNLIRYKGAGDAAEIIQIIVEISNYINLAMIIIINIFYFHQYVHSIIGLLTKAKKWPEAKKNHKYAYLISARNESAVIPYLIDSIFDQNYPKELMTVFVVADNCTDNTAEIARQHGAIVYERFNHTQIGKGYALDFLLSKIYANPEYDDFEAFFVFDADNLVTADYTMQMNRLFDAGVEAATSFRDTKNFDKNWITAGQAISFYRECLLIHHSRGRLGMGTYISGTGFYMKRSIVDKYGGWKFNTLVEDIEFSLNCTLDDIKIEYCEDAVFYDEQPETLKDSINQRLRWCKGTHQCFAKYGGKLLKKGIATFSATAFELMAHVAPMPIISFGWSILYFLLNTIFVLLGAIPLDAYVNGALSSLGGFLMGVVVIVFVHALFCEVRYGRKIKAPWYRQIFYCIMFPVFMFLYLPLSFVALFKKVTWKPIPHKDAKSIKIL